LFAVAGYFFPNGLVLHDLSNDPDTVAYRIQAANNCNHIKIRRRKFADFFIFPV